MIKIVGIGPGSRDYILPAATKALEECSMIVGFQRAVESLDFIDNRKKVVSSLKEILEICHENDHICVAASGDPCFYGIGDYLGRNLEKQISIVPGISSFQYLASKEGISWNGAVTSSMHGRENEFVKEVRERETSFWLTGKKNSPEELCRRLFEHGIQCQVIVGENLSYHDERITRGTPEILMEMKFSPLSVVVVKEGNHENNKR